MMFEGKHIHYSPVDNKPLCSYSGKLCKQRRLSGYAFCIRHILEDKTSPFKQCAHVAKYNNQKCTNPIPCIEDREFCNSHMQVAGMLPKKERKNKKEKEKDLSPPSDGRLKFADRLRALLRKEGCALTQDEKVDEDPYAFPDPVTEKEASSPNNLSCHPRTIWNCVQKTSDSSNFETPQKQEQTHLSKINAVNDGKGKSHVPRLSKTMNRLQAKIAQNKLLDKLKKSQESSHQTVVPTLLSVIKQEPVTISSVNGSHKQHELLERAVRNKKAVNSSRETVVHVLATAGKPVVQEQCNLSGSAKAPKQVKVEVAELPCVNVKKETSVQEHKKVKNNVCEIKKRPVTRDLPQIKKEFQLNATKEMLQRAQNVCRRKKKSSYDGYYFGFIDTDCEDSEEEDECQAFLKLNWCCSLLREAFLWNQTAFGTRPSRNSFLKAELRRYGYLTHKIFSIEKPVLSRLKRTNTSVNKINSCHQKSTSQMTLLEKLSNSCMEKQKKSSGHYEKQNCCYQLEGVKCGGYALPYTSHCLSHIMYNVDQLLYEHCTAKFADNTQCCVPVFDICHELPLCPEHAKKRDNYNKMASEPKPKKARKKTKPSALTRPAKRGKKKKRPPNPLRPSSLPSSPIDNCVNENTSDSVTLETKTGMLNATTDEAMEENIESELGSELEDNFSPGSIEKSLELPLDTVELANQATKLLEEHDFTEVLNKIPDNAFTDLFTDGRNGEYIPSKEETEELERALAAVSKDVHLAKESLAKLTVTRQDIEDLSNSIDLSGGLLSAENLTSSLDENTLREFAQGNIDGLNVMTGLSSSDLTSLTQALSSLPPDSLAAHGGPHMTPVSMMTSHLTNGDSECLLNQETGFGLGGQFLDSTISGYGSGGGSTHVISGGDVIVSSLLLSSTAAEQPANTLAAPVYQTSRSTNGRVEDGPLGSVVACTSSQWLLNPSLALSQLGYQNGFQGGQNCVSPQLLSSLSKFPLQALSAEVSLISNHHHGAASNIYEDSMLCTVLKDSVQTLGVRQSAPPVAVQETKPTILAQEGAS